MRKQNTSVLLAAMCLYLAGCQTQNRSQPRNPVLVPMVEKSKSQPPSTPPPKKRPQEQIQMLQDFAMKESPKIWQTIQSMRAEMVTSGTKLKQLRADLLEFDRDPDADEDYKALVAGLKELRRAYDTIFDRLVDAYIAAKKYEASPSRKDYQDMMRRALEDGVQDANIAIDRYRAMMRLK